VSTHIVTVYLPLRLRMLIQQDCAKNEQLPATVILRILTEHFKDDMPEVEFDALIYEYSLTAFEQQKAKREKERAQKADARERKLREEIALCDLRIKDHNTANPQYWERRKKRVEEQLNTYLTSKNQ
jgi:hypothetical protein